MLIRAESLADIISIDQLYLSLKGKFIEKAEQIRTLRENGNNTISLVACDDEGNVIGHAMFTPVRTNGEDRNWQRLFSLTVMPNEHDVTIKKQLVTEGINSLSELGYPVCVAFGDEQPFLPENVFQRSENVSFDENSSMPILVCEMYHDDILNQNCIISSF